MAIEHLKDPGCIHSLLLARRKAIFEETERKPVPNGILEDDSNDGTVGLRSL